MKVSKMKKFAVLILIIVSAQCLSTQAVEKEENFKLNPGPYLMKVNTIRNGRQSDITTKIKISVADNNSVTFHTAHASRITQGEIKGNDFTATIKEKGETTLQGKLVSDNKIIGKFFPSKDVDFPSEISGTFVIEPDKDKDATVFWENEEKWRAEKTAIPKLTAEEEAQLQKYQKYQKEQAERYNKPISFYGKVIDEGSHPVKDAKAEITIERFPPELDPSNVMESMVVYARKRMKTDENGLFQIPVSEGKMGFRLNVVVSKEGYKWINNEGEAEKGFKYSQRDLNDQVFTPDPENPVVFILKKTP